MSFLDELAKPFFVLAPMDDVTDSVFRQIVADLSAPDLYFTEFVNVDGLQSLGRQRLLHKLLFTDKERPIIAQLWGLKPENFYKTAREIADGTLLKEARELHSEAGKPSQKKVMASRTAGFDGVDLNMGCPVRTVIKNGACAALMNNRELAGQIIDATREGVGDEFPVSVKTRVGFTTVDLTWIEFLLSKKILNMLSIHGRTAKQLSKSPADWALIGEVRKMRDVLSPTTLVVGNGDVESRAQAVELAKRYRLDGVMIGRGIFDDPFIFANDSPWVSYSKEQKGQLYRKHVELFAKTWNHGERRIETLNKFCKIYINGFDGAKELREKLMAANSAEELLGIL